METRESLRCQELKNVSGRVDKEINPVSDSNESTNQLKINNKEECGENMGNPNDFLEKHHQKVVHFNTIAAPSYQDQIMTEIRNNFTTSKQPGIGNQESISSTTSQTVSQSSVENVEFVNKDCKNSRCQELTDVAGREDTEINPLSTSNESTNQLKTNCKEESGQNKVNPNALLEERHQKEPYCNTNLLPSCQDQIMMAQDNNCVISKQSETDIEESSSPTITQLGEIALCTKMETFETLGCQELTDITGREDMEINTQSDLNCSTNPLKINNKEECGENMRKLNDFLEEHQQKEEHCNTIAAQNYQDQIMTEVLSNFTTSKQPEIGNQESISSTTSQTISQSFIENVEFVNEDHSEISEGVDSRPGTLTGKIPASDTYKPEDGTAMDSMNNDDVVFVSQMNSDDSHKNATFMNTYRPAVVPYSDTDDSDSSSSSSSCDSDSSEESSVSESEGPDSENKLLECSVQRKTMLSPLKAPKVKGELEMLDLPPIEDLHISVRNDQVVEIGKVLHIVDTLVVVECYKDQPPLDIDSVLFLDCGARPLGRVFDVMGPVTEPLYCVRFNSKLQIEEHNIYSGMLVYCAPHTEHSNFVFVQKLVQMKGSDASWKEDKEVPLSELDFSDDDEESKIRKKGEGHSTVVVTKCTDEPRSKVSKTANQQITPSCPSDASRFQGYPRGAARGEYRPRNPWGWPGAKNDFSRNRQQQQKSVHPNQSCSQSPVMPSLLHYGLQSPYQKQPSTNSSRPGNLIYRSDSQFGRKSDPVQFNQLPPNTSNNYNPSWTSNLSPVSNQGTYNPQNSSERFNSSWSSHERPASSQRNFHPNNNFDYSQSWTSNEAPSSSQGNYTSHNISSQSRYPTESYHPQQNPENQRYLAFQSEIAKLVDAYNSGAASPAAVPPSSNGMRPPPSFSIPPPPSFGNQHPTFSVGVRAPRPPFSHCQGNRFPPRKQ